MDTSKPDFQETYASFQPRILRYLSRLAGEDEAEDLAQEVFARVAAALPGFRGESSLSTWLYRIATNAALDRMRSPSYRQAAQQKSVDEPGGEIETRLDDRNAWSGEKTPLVEQQVYRKEMNDCIRDFIGKLPEDYRAVLVLGELEGLANAEIAEILQLSLATVKIRLHRARARLQAELAENCDSYWIEQNEFVPELKRVRKKQL